MFRSGSTLLAPALGLLAFTFGCGGDSSTSPPGPDVVSDNLAFSRFPPSPTSS